ncbi:hypothetical protein OIE66_17860 [Nonomuraea sp. NBC_01738]|uniref:hypothetical protein n=1 Tax=Nonomuraea sp. NBC_01738 TaxID=2976003 RepID=UPI002E162C35|nr:hypothetical protein OIE66_17860 [Nonomuraea sp. NBC_01738]
MSVQEWYEPQLVTTQLRQRRTPGWERVNASAAQLGITLTPVRECDTRVRYEVGGRQLVLPQGDLPPAVADEVIAVLAKAGA